MLETYYNELPRFEDGYCVHTLKGKDLHQIQGYL